MGAQALVVAAIPGDHLSVSATLDVPTTTDPQKITQQIEERLLSQLASRVKAVAVTEPLCYVVHDILSHLSIEPRSAQHYLALCIDAIIQAKMFRPVLSRGEILVSESLFQQQYHVCSGGKDATAELVMLGISGNLVANLTFGLVSCQVVLKVSQFVTHSSDSQFAVCNLNGLIALILGSLLRQVSHPSRSSKTSLVQLPADVLYTVLTFLSGNELASISPTCSRFQNMSSLPFLWHEFYRNEFKRDPQVISDWKNEYISHYFKQQRRLAPHTIRLHPFRGPRWHLVWTQLP